MQAILISAYKNQKYLERLINFFDKKCMVYVHIDYKSDIVPENLNVVCPQNVEIYKKYKINWGSYSHLEAILFLLKRALKNPNINFIHIISGQDMPVKRLEDFNCFEKDNLIYMGHFKVTDIDPKIAIRFEHGTLFPKADQGNKMVKIINRFYAQFHKKREFIGEYNYNQIYKGLVWVSIPRYAAKYVINYNQKNNFCQALYHVSIPEEFFFQTILENSPFKKNIQANSLIYNDWDKERNGSLPAILDASDYKKIINSNCFFARKIDPKISQKLINKFSNTITDF